QADEETYSTYLNLISDRYKPYWYASIYNHIITQKAKLELSQSQPVVAKIGRLMNQHQKILEECIQNTPEGMQIQMNAARNAGALGAKIIGSGGGGCMVALATDESKKAIIQAFLSAGAQKAYEVKLTE
ncbi:MAG: GHMP kinase, partial [Flavobacteriaceae bacterium]